jgi:hypothetical protein
VNNIVFAITKQTRGRAALWACWIYRYDASRV